MDSTSVPTQDPTQAGELVPSSSPVISLDTPQALLEFLSKQNDRIAALEAEQQRFADALKKAGEFIFNSPQGKMISMAFPKEMQAKLREFFKADPEIISYGNR